MSDIEKRLEMVERLVEMILIAHANSYYQPLNDKESEYVDDMQKRMGRRGYSIAGEKLMMQEATLKYENLKLELQQLESDYPALKGRRYEPV